MHMPDRLISGIRTGIRSAAVVMLSLGAPAFAALQTPALPALFTSQQASRGRAIYAAECASCHGVRLNDGAAVVLAGPAFLQKWGHPQVTLDDLFYIVQTTMPKNRGGTLPAADYEAVLAYLLEQNAYPAGSESRLTSQEQRSRVHLTSTISGAVAPDFIPG